MPVYVSNAYALSPAGIAQAWKPRILWHNLATFHTISADYEDADYPVTNLSNPASYLLWKSGSTAAQNLTVLFSYNDDVDCIAFERHNYGSGLILVTVEGLTPGGDPDDDDDWTELVAQQLLADDSTAMFIFEPTTVAGLRLVLVPDAVAPQAGVLRCGTSITLPYGMPVGHVPISSARWSVRQTPMTQGGDYTGAVELTAGLRSSIEQQDLDPDWYWANLDPFRLACATDTFFFAPFPQKYPSQTAYCWVTNDPMPKINRTTGEIDITFEINAVAS